VISQIQKMPPKPSHSLGVQGSQRFHHSSGATEEAAHALDRGRPLPVPHLITKPRQLDTNCGRRTSVNLCENVRYVRTHLLYGPKTHTNVEPIEDISGSLWNCPLDHAFETIGSVGEDRHAGLFGPAVVLQCCFDEFPST